MFLSYKELLRLEEYTYAMPSFGFGYWTFNNPQRKPSYRDFNGKLIRPPVHAYEKGLYIHIWLFSNRFDLDFRKEVPNEIKNES